MPIQKLIFKPGVNREGTTLTNEGSWFETDKVRFRSGFPEKIGGWAAISSNKFLGVCRSLWGWITLKNFNLLGVGTNQKFYVENGGNYYDITPLSFNAPGNLTAITITAGTHNAVITVSAGPSFKTGDIVVISGIISPVGDISAAILNQQYQITYVSGSQFSIRMRNVSPIESPGPYKVSTTGGSVSGLTAKVAFLLSTGLPIYTVGTGWGVGPWSPYESVTLTNPFTTTLNSSTITVTYASHGLTAGQYVVFDSIQTDFGNLKTYSPPSPEIAVDKSVLLRTFEVLTTPTGNTFTISLNESPVIIRATSAVSLQGGTVVMRRQNPADVLYKWGAAYDVGGISAGLQLRLWSQANYGEDLIINPRGGALYLWQPGSGAVPDYGTRAQLISGTNIPDQVNEVMVSDATRIVIAFGCNDYDPPIGTGDYDPMLIRWSNSENYLEWTPDATNQAGSYRLSHGSEIIAVLQTRQEILIWTDAALYSMQYLGPPYVWGFNILADNISLMSPNSVTTANGMVFWMGTDKFYMYSGRVETLPSALRQYVFQDVNKDQGFQIFAGTNEGYSEVWWFYCSQNSNMIDRYVVFNYLDQVWYYGNMQRTAWLDSALRQYPQAAISVQNALLVSQSISVPNTSLSATATQILVDDTSGFPNSGYVQIDSEIIYYEENNGNALTKCVRGALGSVAAIHAVDAIITEYAANVVLFHEYGNDDASDLELPRPIESFIQSSDIDLDDGDRYMFVWQMVPDFSFDGSTTANPNRPEVLVQLRPRQNPGSAYGYANSPDVKADQSQSYDSRHTYAVQEFTDLVNTRIRGRQVALRITSETLGTRWQLGALRINMRPDGRR